MSRWLTGAVFTGVLLPLWAQAEVSQKQLHEEVLANARANADFGQGKYAAARMLWLRLAEMGNAHAMYSLGTLYQDGLGVAQDDDLAFFWLDKAGQQGEPNGLFALSVAWREGLGTPVSTEKAAEFRRRAAYAGVPEAQVAIGQEALGAGRLEQAWYWFTTANAGRSPDASAGLEQLREQGFNPPLPSYGLRDRIHRFLEEMDSALNARDTEILRLLLTENATIRLNGPTDDSAQTMNPGEYLSLLDETFRRVDRFRAHRGRISISTSSRGFLVNSPLHHYLAGPEESRIVDMLEELELRDTPNGLRATTLNWYTERTAQPILVP
ncbi:MAG: tetratricopeptide repeat protein [Cellvibrionales bacterium]|jgi:TPR repeat protein